MLIAIEGIDGAGKTTIAKFLAEELRKRGYDVVVLKEPSDSEYGKLLKSLKRRLSAEEELDLFLKDRKVDVERNILPALREGKVVIMDRYYYSNVAYQAARGLDGERIKRLNEEIAPKPDLVILLDVDVGEALRRISNRKERTVFEEKDYLEEVRKKFLEFADNRVVVIDASRPLEDVKREVLRVVESTLRARP
ncbi:MAG: dTMP kinase [Archaeoglobaceae archaeon]